MEQRRALRLRPETNLLLDELVQLCFVGEGPGAGSAHVVGTRVFLVVPQRRQRGLHSLQILRLRGGLPGEVLCHLGQVIARLHLRKHESTVEVQLLHLTLAPIYG